jgi:hypothetical protein
MQGGECGQLVLFGGEDERVLLDDFEGGAVAEVGIVYPLPNLRQRGG